MQFSISIQFNSIWPTDRTLSGATTSGQSELWSDTNEGILYIPQSSSITGTLPSDCFVSYTGHSMEESYLSAVMQSVYSAALANLAIVVVSERTFGPRQFNVDFLIFSLELKVE